MRQSRIDRAQGLDDGTRLRLIEDDLDTLESELHTMNDRLSKILWALIGLLISVTTAAILLAVNIGVAPG